MKKLFTISILFILVSSFLSCAKDEGTETFQTTIETTTLETERNTQVYSELLAKMSGFDEAFSNTSGLDIYVNSTVDIYMGGNSGSDIANSQSISMRYLVDSVDPYYYSDISISGEGRFIQITEAVGNKYLVYTRHNNRIQTDVVLEQELGVNEMLEGVYQSGDMSRLLPDNLRYYKLNENYYRVVMSLQHFAFLNPEMFSEMEEMVGNTFELSDIFVEIIFQFDFQGFDFFMTVNIDPFALTELGDNYVGMTTAQGVKVLDTIDRIYFDLDTLIVEGATSIENGIYTIRDDVDERVYLHHNSNNYFRYYFEEGFYCIDDFEVAHDTIAISLYNSEHTIIPGSKVYSIEEDGYYYLNFLNKSSSDLTLSPLVYKLEETEVGVPSAPLTKSESPFTLTSNMESINYLINNSISEDGLFVLKKESSAEPGFIPYFTYSSGRVFQNYYTFIIEEDNILAMYFEKIADIDTTYSWEFIPSGQDTTIYQDMRTYLDDYPTFIYLNEDNPNTNIRFHIAETRVVSFEQEQGIFYGDELLMNVYSDDGQLVETDVFEKSVELAPGYYYLGITSDGYNIHPNYIYFVLLIN